ncbi:sigma 54-interacting transcriptional regulator [bacterium]|nr:sigma 54-interacting transcriptional regulator [bacterium]
MTDKHLLAITSLFDRDFSIDWIVELTGCKASKVITILEEGVKKEYLVHRGAGIYFFSNSETRMELSKELQEQEISDFHHQIAELLLKELPEDDKKAQIVAFHLLHTKNTIDRCRYLIQAGDASQKAFKTQKAFQCYAKVLDDLSNLEGEDVDELFAQTAIKYSKISTARHDTSKVVETLLNALNRAKRLRDLATQSLLEMHIAKNEWLQGNHSSAMKRFDIGWKIASGVNDYKLQRSATTFGTFFLYWQGRFKEAVESYETYVSDVEKYPKGGFPLLATITLGYCYSQIGQITQGLGMIDAVRTLCLEREDLNLASYTAGNMGCIMADIQNYDDAIAHIRISGKEAAEANNNWVRITGYLVLAYCYYHKGEQKKSIRFFTDFLKQRKEIQASVNLYPYVLELLWLMEIGKLPPLKGYSLEQELYRTIRSKNIFMKGVAYRYQALLFKKEDEPLQKIIGSLDQSLKWLEQSGHQFQMAETQLEIARIQVQQGKTSEAREIIKSASLLLTPYAEIKLPEDLLFLTEDHPINEQLFKEILHLGQQVADVVHSKDLLNRVLTSVNRMTGAERCALFLLDDADGQPKFRLRASKNITQAQITHPEFSSSMKMLERVCETGKGMIIEANESDEPDFFSNESIKSRICVPMTLRNRVIGVLYNDNRLLSSAFKKYDLDLLGYFAAQAAFAIDNARAYNEIKQLNQRLSQEKEYYKEEHTQNLKSNNIIGESASIKEVLSQVKQVAETEATALILGHTGVGKELVAREIHNLSSRKDKPFIRVHCAALPENLIPSELFGHEKGAFTGAISRRVGRFELADGGTLFLDEIGDIPPDVQVRLLRVIQTHEFERVGGSITLQSDFRLITATNKDLEAEVKKNRFRADLYYRLNVFPIRVPNLSERKEDIPLLANYFLNIYSKKMRKSFAGIPEEEMKNLLDYDWPGNVRELENVIERGTILSLGQRFRTPELRISAITENEYENNMSLQEVEKRHILKVLKKTGWKVRGPGGAAEILKIHPSTLHFRMKKLGISRDKI